MDIHTFRALFQQVSSGSLCTVDDIQGVPLKMLQAEILVQPETAISTSSVQSRKPITW